MLLHKKDTKVYQVFLPLLKRQEKCNVKFVKVCNLLNSMEYQKSISVCISVYNASSFLQECIDSILSQSFSDFELLIVDDGSTDNSVQIIESYADKRIRLIRNKHDYIQSLNLLLSEAKGKYIARMDADDIMLSDRLAMQFKCMEENPNIDVLSASTIDIFTDSSKNCCSSVIKELRPADFVTTNPIVHPTTFIRNSALYRKKMKYKESYKYAEDYGLWCECILSGLKIFTMSSPVIKYRISEQQVTCKYSSIMKKVFEKISDKYSYNLCKKYNKKHKNITEWETNNRLTAIIPFLNEGADIINTVKSLRHFLKDRIDIIVINDQSTDGYPYSNELEKYNVHYIINWKRQGVAGARDYGVHLCKTPYFVLMDGHMRIYDSEWLSEICNRLDADDRQILCMQTRQLWKNLYGQVVEVENAASVYGAYLTLRKNEYCPGIEWNHSEPQDSEEIFAILGAGYAASRRYWKKIQGLKGLQQYGCDEAFLSLKVWLEGGKCILLKKHSFGHIYRDKAPYDVRPISYAYNFLLIAYILFPKNLWLWALTSCRFSNFSNTNSALLKIKQRKYFIDLLKKEFDKIRNVDFYTIWKRNQAISITSHDNTLFSSENLRKIYNNIIDPISNNGIVSGNMARWIWTSHYAKIYNIKDCRINLFYDVICCAIKERTLPLNFKNGLLGIGWGLFYMYSEKLIDDIDFEILERIDEEISYIDVENIKDYSLFWGLGGLLAYICNRICYSYRKGLLIPWNRKFVSKYKKVARHVIMKGGEFSTVFYAYIYLEWTRFPNDFSWYKPFLSDWFSISKSLPKNPQYWSYDLFSGCLSQTICLMKFEPITL